MMRYLEEISFPVKAAKELSQRMGYVNCLIVTRDTHGLNIDKSKDALASMFPLLDINNRMESFNMARYVIDGSSHDLINRFLNWGVVDDKLTYLSAETELPLVELYAVWVLFEDYLRKGKSWSINVTELADVQRNWLNSMAGVELIDHSPEGDDSYTTIQFTPTGTAPFPRQAA